jgi:hypothetical protein
MARSCLEYALLISPGNNPNGFLLEKLCSVPKVFLGFRHYDLYLSLQRNDAHLHNAWMIRDHFFLRKEVKTMFIEQNHAPS